MAFPFKKSKAGSTDNERLVGKITADLAPLEERQRQIEAALVDDDLILPAYLGELEALAKQAALRNERTELARKIEEATAALTAVRKKVQLETQARIAAKKRADIEAHFKLRQKQRDAAVDWDKALAALADAYTRMMDAGDDLAPSYAAVTGSPPGFGLMTGSGEIHKAARHDFFRVSATEFIGGGISDKPQRPSLPGSLRPDNVYRAPTAEQRALPPQKWVPSLVQVIDETATWERNILEGKTRYDGKPVDGATDETPADPALWQVPGPQAPASEPEPQRASPHIVGLPDAATADAELAAMLAPAPKPAPAAPPKPGKGSFKVGGVVIESSVDDGPSFTPDQIAAMELENFRKSPKGAYPAPARKIDLGEL